MKVCPVCGTRYTDETLQYCLQDGTPLQVEGSGTAAPIFDDPATVVRQRSTDTRETPQGPRSRTGLVILLTAVLTAGLLILGGIGAWLFLRGGRTPAGENTNISATPTSTPDKTPITSPSPSANTNEAANSNAATNDRTSDPAADARARREITRFIAEWTSATESKNIGAFGDEYADTVAYYNNPSASRAEVQADKKRAFSLYDHINIQISNIKTTVDASGESAVTSFDKEWEFAGEKASRGKVRSELRLRRIDGKWKIVGERDQKVYYTE